MSLTVLGEGRRFRVVWLLEEMGLACRLRPATFTPRLDAHKEKKAWVASLADQ
jgi:hypothetical protein